LLVASMATKSIFVLLVTSIVAMGLPNFSLQRHEMLPDLFSHITAMCGDNDFLYAAADGYLLKFNKDDLSDYGVLTLDDSGNEVAMDKIDAIQVDDAHVYLIGFVAEGSGPSQRSQRLLKIDKQTMQRLSSELVPSEWGFSYSISLDTDHVYTAHASNPGRVAKWNKASLNFATIECNGHSDPCNPLVLPLESAQIRSMEVEQVEIPETNPLQYQTHLYANCYTTPGRTVKIATTSSENGLVLVNSTAFITSAEFGVNNISVAEHPLAGFTHSTGTHVYTVTFTAPSTLVVLKKSDMHIVNEVVLTGFNEAVAIDGDARYLYIANYESPSKVMRFLKSSLIVPQQGTHSVPHVTITLPTNYNKLAVLVHAGSTLFAATNTAPAGVVQFGGYLEGWDCQLSEWSHWGDCTESCCCSGEKTRTRTITDSQQSAELESTGLGICADESLSQTTACNREVACSCDGAQIWSWSADATPKTCNETHAHGNVQPPVPKCTCPNQHPYAYHHDDQSDGTIWCVDEEFCSEKAKESNTSNPQSSLPTPIIEPCEPDLECSFGSDGIMRTTRNSHLAIEYFHCQHTASRFTESCRCLCRKGAGN